MKFLSLLFLTVVSSTLITSCAKVKEGEDPLSHYSPCGDSFIEKYNAVSVRVRQVKQDVDHAYGEEQPKDAQELQLARETAYEHAQSCKTQAVAFRKSYVGIQCVAMIENKKTLIDVNERMDSVIRAMDTVPVP